MKIKTLKESESQSGQRISVDQLQTFSIWVLLRSLELGGFCLNPALLLLSCQFEQIEASSRLLEKILQAEIVIIIYIGRRANTNIYFYHVTFRLSEKEKI